MRDLYGMTYEEIAASIGCPAGTVKSRIARGRLKLTELLSEPGEPGAGRNRLTGK